MSTPATPKPPTAEELLAVATPEAPKELEFTFPDGTVVKGKDKDELLAVAAKRYDDVQKHAQQVKAENAELRKVAQPAVTAPAPVSTSGFDPNHYWQMFNEGKIPEANAYAEACFLGFSGPNAAQEMKQVLSGTVNVAQDVVEKGNVAGFLAMAPDFPNTAETCDILADRMVAMGVANPTVDAMLAAHALCLKEGKYQASGEAPPAGAPAPNMPVPPPAPPAGAAGISGVTPNLEEMANAMTPAQLREAILKMQAGGSQ